MQDLYGYGFQCNRYDRDVVIFTILFSIIRTTVLQMNLLVKLTPVKRTMKPLFACICSSLILFAVTVFYNYFLSDETILIGKSGILKSLYGLGSGCRSPERCSM